MSANIMDNDKVVVVGKPAWHELGLNFQEPISAGDAYEKMGGGFTLSHLPVGVMLDGNTFSPIEKNFAIVRGPTNKDNRQIVFDYTTERYHIVQPIEIIQKFDEKVGVSIETLGFIGDGRKMFLTWNLPNFDVVEGDTITLYGSVMFGFDNLFSSRLNILTQRILCENTWRMALAEENAEKGKNRGRGNVYSGKHVNKGLLNELGEWMGYIHKNAEIQTNQLKSFFGKLHQTPIVHEQQAKDLIYQTWPNPQPVPDYYPDALREKKQEKIDVEAERVEKIRNGVETEYFSNNPAHPNEETYYRLFNAGTYYFNHVMPSKKETNFSTVWGGRSNEMNLFAEVLQHDIYG